MKTFLHAFFSCLLLLMLGPGLYGQITFQGCTNIVTTSVNLSTTGTTSDGATRNTFESVPVNYTDGGGAFEFRITWTSSRWEIAVDGDGTPTPNYETLLYYNNSASHPNPPDLTLGTWTKVEPACVGGVTILSGDVQSDITLPVVLTSFTAQQQDGRVQLAWQTASELNNQRFEVERSLDGKRFVSIGEVAGKGTTTRSTDYAFVDEQPALGSNYYRLKQVDLDGQYEYSQTVETRLDAEQLLQLAPNPAQGHVSLEFAQPFSGTVSLHDQQGQLVEVRNFSQAAHRQRLDLTSLPVGVYTLRLQLPNGSVYRKLLKWE